jgi:hypothetical protein
MSIALPTFPPMNNMNRTRTNVIDRRQIHLVLRAFPANETRS